MEFVEYTNSTAKEGVPYTYCLAVGVQVRAEKPGLLFYSRKGPRLYFLSSGQLLAPEYFDSRLSLKDWLNKKKGGMPPASVMQSLKQALNGLVEKGVLDVT